MALLKIANVNKSYNITKTQKQDVLKGVNIEFKSGDLVALLGESGCGKSTLINILGGLDTDYTGSIVIKGDFIRDFSDKQMDDYRKKRVGLIFQNYNLISHMTIKENVEIAMAISDIDEKVRLERAMDLLKMVGLANFKNKLPNQLSGGQKQRVAIARALANNPTIILADEPTGALDKNSADLVMKILKKIAESGKLVIIVTHSQKVADECSRVIKLDEGIIVDDKTTNKLHIDSKRDKEIVPKSIKTKDLANLAYKNVNQNKNRSLLVSLGLSIGIAAVLLILCLSSGLTSYVNNVYGENLQSTQLTITKTSDTNFTSTQISYIEELDGIEDLTETFAIYTASYSIDDSITFTSIDKIQTYYDDYQPTLLYGSIIADTDTTYYVLVNETLATVLGDGSLISCVGQTITIKGTSTKTFIISGIYQDNSDSPTDTNVYVSETGMQALANTSSLSTNMIYITASDVTYMSALKSDLTALGFTVYQEDSSVDSVLEYIDLGTSILTAVSAISMVVSAIMIFIVLYISVTERMKEIGILRAVGARKKDISNMFLFEAMLLGLVGGIFGVLICATLSIITNVICLSTLSYSLISYNVGYYLIGIFASVIISVLAGIAPAIRASDLDPVEALRAE